jgi:hypothetical protein
VRILSFPSVFEGRDGPSEKNWTEGQTGKTKGKFKHSWLIAAFSYSIISFLINSSIIHLILKGSGTDNSKVKEEIGNMDAKKRAEMARMDE